MWGLDKANKTPMQVDSKLKEVYELAREIRAELERIRNLTEETLIKAQISHSLLVVRKIDETKLEEHSTIIMDPAYVHINTETEKKIQEVLL